MMSGMIECEPLKLLYINRESQTSDVAERFEKEVVGRLFKA